MTSNLQEFYRCIAVGNWFGKNSTPGMPYLFRLLPLLMWMASGCARSDGQLLRTQAANKGHSGLAIPMKFGDREIESVFAASNKLERDLLRKVLDLEWASEKGIIIVCGFPTAWQIKPKSITHFPEASNVAPLLYIVTTGTQTPRCTVWEREEAIKQSISGTKSIGRVLSVFEYEKAKGWKRVPLVNAH